MICGWRLMRWRCKISLSVMHVMPLSLLAKPNQRFWPISVMNCARRSIVSMALSICSRVMASSILNKTYMYRPSVSHPRIYWHWSMMYLISLKSKRASWCLIVMSLIFMTPFMTWSICCRRYQQKKVCAWRCSFITMCRCVSMAMRCVLSKY